MKNDASHRARMRAHGLVLSSEGITIKAIAKISHVDRDTVAPWIKQWEKHGAKSWHDQPRSGRPTTRHATEKELAKQYMKEEPRSLTHVVERFAQKTAKRLSISSWKRLAKTARLRGKRVRKSFKSLRDPRAFAKGKRALAAWQQQAEQGKIARYYFDASGFTLDPSMPYAWQEPGTVRAIPARKCGRINVWGFMHSKNDLPPFLFAQSVPTSVVIAGFEACSQTLKKQTVVVMENASVHPSEAFEACLPQWQKKGLIIKYVTPYAPELNLIAILWRNITYTWLPFSAYQGLNALRDALENILKNFGSKYQITFA
jgi:transposase